MPRWLGFLLVAVGILCLTPIGFIGFLLTLLWIGALGVVLFLRGTSDHDGAVGPGASAPGTVRPADAPGPPVTPGPPPSGGGTTPAGLA